jgi:uroporphyrinogen III methyltransferase/synthase
MAKDTKGIVYLVGAGPGDPGLLTVRARSLIESADVIVYDKLANPQLLDWSQETAEKIYVGKSAGRHSIPQEEIEAILIARAEQGLRVVRLKGGDPFVFGRGGEEIESLNKAAISFEIIPGVTAALAAAAYAGIPLSHRDHSSAITFLTGHENPEKQKLQLDFREHAHADRTLCIYMGVGQLPRIISELSEGGLSADTPVAIIEWATHARQRSLYSTLGKIVVEQEASEIGAPAIIFVGKVLNRPSANDWFTARPLFGKRIVVTRAREQAGRLSTLLSAQGADVIELPFIEVKPKFDPKVLTEVFAEMAVYEWIVFTSANGVRIFFELFFKAYPDIRCLGPMRIAAVGRATAEAIEEYRLKVDLVPEKANGDALVNELIEETGVESVKMLVVTGNLNRKALAGRLEKEGRAIVDTLPLYETTKADLSEHPNAKRYREAGAHAILFTSASTVKSFQEQQEALTLAPTAKQPAHGSIGPMTSKALEAQSLSVDFQSPISNLEHFVVETITHLK